MNRKSHLLGSPHTNEATELMTHKRKIDDEIAFLRVRFAKMTDIVARMRPAKVDGDYDKMTDLKDEQDSVMGR